MSHADLPAVVLSHLQTCSWGGFKLTAGTLELPWLGCSITTVTPVTVTDINIYDKHSVALNMCQALN